ncbi:hypothetical protein IAE35_13605 [Pseudomonas sp. S75]|uniref:hypothetical protein n=1 Tax=unclassified Pseudomonas TaxID=196821 RepID=UPI0019057EAA|nr:MULTISPECIES: hypothetical protein [unclassified Pseudomonas]MBJ9976563.1 hypothetical protein [Pseudomonas sp. S30]MBK0154379.1 hypothetical protein [Pseudomonas sp. S75]
MSPGGASPANRAAFHQQHQLAALAEAERLLAQRSILKGAWFDWVAAQLYQLGPPPFVSMVRRELQRLTQA